MNFFKTNYNKLGRCVLALVLFVFSSCKYTCEEFPESELKWIPYQVGDGILYSDGLDTISFEVTNAYFNKEISERGLFTDIVCPIEAFYETDEVQEYKIREHYGVDFRGAFEARFSDRETFYFFLNRMSLENDSIVTNYAIDTLINNVVYSEVYFVQKKDISSGTRASWIIKSANEGIVQFYDNEQDKTWVKLD